MVASQLSLIHEQLIVILTRRAERLLQVGSRDNNHDGIDVFPLTQTVILKALFLAEV